MRKRDWAFVSLALLVSAVAALLVGALVALLLNAAVGFGTVVAVISVSAGVLIGLMVLIFVLALYFLQWRAHVAEQEIQKGVKGFSARTIFYATNAIVAFVAIVVGTLAALLTGALSELVLYPFLGLDGSAVALSVFLALLLGAVVFAMIMLAYVGQGLVYVDVDPEHTALVEVLGEPNNDVKPAGWRFAPFNGFLTTLRKIRTQKEAEDFEDIGYQTGDGVSGTLENISVVWEPIKKGDQRVEDSSGNDVHPLRNFISYGKHDGVHDRLREKVTEAIISFMHAHVATWSDVYALGNILTIEVLEAIGGRIKPDIPSSVDKDLLMVHFEVERPKNKEKYTESQKAKFPEGADIDQEIRKMISEDETGAYGQRVKDEGHDDYVEHLRSLLKERHRSVLDLKAGQGCIELPDWGIRIFGIDIGERYTDPNVVEEKARITIEKLQKESENIQNRHFVDMAKKLKDDADFKGSLDDAFRLMLVMTNKMTGSKAEFREVKFTLDEPTARAIGRLGTMGAKFVAQFTGLADDKKGGKK